MLESEVRSRHARGWMRWAVASAMVILLLSSGDWPSAATAPMPLSGRVIPMPRTYLCSRSNGPIAVDGMLDDAGWRQAAWTEDFVDIEGYFKPIPRFRTRAKMTWDDSCFYIGAELREPDVHATLTKRDTVIFHDNDFEVFIDPNGDNLEYYEMEMNALNTVWDLFLPIPYKDGGHPMDSWDIEGLKTAVAVNGTLNHAQDTDSGWTVEIAMPWRSLATYAHKPAPPAEGDRWRVNFSRVEWEFTAAGGKYQKIPGKREDNWVWSPQWVVDMHRPEMWGYVQFTSGQTRLASPDKAWEVKCILHGIYYAERRFFERERRWASTFSELGYNAAPVSAQGKAAALHAGGSGFRVSLQLLLPSGRVERWNIRQDSRIWADTLAHN